MFSDHEKCCSYCQRRKKLERLAGLASYIMGLPEPKSLTQTKGASSSAYADKLKELGAMIKVTAKPISDYERKKQYRLSQPKTKGASYVNPTDRIERRVKLGELGKMIKGL